MTTEAAELVPTEALADTNGNNGDTWESRYGEVVWAKFSGFPWWPACILDPHKVLKRENCKKQAIAHMGKQHTVYFYADDTLGFATPSNIKAFTEENKKTFLKQKILKSYEKAFPKAIEVAEEEIKLEKDKRLAWYLAESEREAIKEGKIEGYFTTVSGENEGKVDLDEVCYGYIFVLLSFLVFSSSLFKSYFSEGAPSPAKKKRKRPSASTQSEEKKVLSLFTLFIFHSQNDVSICLETEIQEISSGFG
jgi:hypothetical protein